FLNFLIVLPAAAQKMPEVDALNRVILNHKDSIVYAHVLPVDDHKKVKPKDKYRYYWYAAHDIKITRGGFDGKLLHGIYTEFYHDKELKVKGTFKKGLKKGSWKSWYRNGQLTEILHYKKGFRHGTFTQFDQDGNTICKGKYKKDKLNGRQKVYVSGGDVVIKKYKNGKEIVAKPKKVKKISAKSNKGKDSTAVKQKKFLWIFKKKPKDAVVAPDGSDEKQKKKRSKKEPRIRVRRSIKVVPQETKPTT
ncbi:MAG: hypothetical protein K0R51_2897, partial [Cytophagaceae bacterium]|nr:hypothetical protein [Cytophagaceae bacterium]